ncbi:MAG: hypothetical protein Q9220_007423 [cf. Caloplaca sp. 1 TL-2023]
MNLSKDVPNGDMSVSINSTDLPDRSSKALRLVEATEAEMIECSTMNAMSWRGPLTTEKYLLREAHLRDQAFTRNGGITYWVLVDTSVPLMSKGVRRILSSCETLRKRALIAEADGRMKEVISHGIGSVYCNPAFRGKGYAQRMLVELANNLDTWQQEEGANVAFTVLWSDIGKTFYAKFGWEVYPSTHIALPPEAPHENTEGLPVASILQADDLKDLCRSDEVSLRRDMSRPASHDRGIRVALVADIATMQWHHAREEFLAQELFGRRPMSKGAMARTPDGRRAWCIWTRTFGSSKEEMVLNILRLVVEGEVTFGRQPLDISLPGNTGKPDQAMVQAIAAILRAAQHEAADWAMSSVQFWNPSPLSVSGARLINPSVVLTDRDDESIASLRWHGDAPSKDTKIDWVSNEKYAWC